MPIDLQYNLYGKLLYRLRQRYKCTESDLCARLKPRFHELRQAYRVNFVDVEYRDVDLVAAYLLGYFPKYAFMSSVTLQQIAADLPRDVRCAVLCGGPLPEVLGLVSAMPACRSVRVIAPDLHAARWEWAREVCADICASYSAHVRPDVVGFDCNLLAPLPDGIEHFRNLDLVILQNCINEIGEEPQFVTNLAQICDGLRHGGYLMLADQNNYPACRQVMTAIRDMFLGRGFETIDDCEEPWPLGISFALPACVSEDFFESEGRVDGNGFWIPPERASSRMQLRSLLLRKL